MTAIRAAVADMKDELIAAPAAQSPASSRD
jgi:hypothetical protein